LFIASCGDGGGISMTPEQRADRERERVIELLIPEMVQDEDWPFDSDADATRQIASCWADEVVMTLGLDSEELESLLARDSDSQNPLERLVQDLPDQGVELGFSILACFEDNARKTDFLKLMSGSDSTRTTLTTISWKADEETKILDGQVDWDGTPIETTTSIAPTTTTRDLQHLYDKSVFFAGCEEQYLGPDSNYSLLNPEGKVLWNEQGFTQADYEDVVTGFCECSFERYVKEIPYLSYQEYSEPDKEQQIVRECQNQAIDLKFRRKE